MSTLELNNGVNLYLILTQNYPLPWNLEYMVQVAKMILLWCLCILFEATKLQSPMILTV